LINTSQIHTFILDQLFLPVNNVKHAILEHADISSPKISLGVKGVLAGFWVVVVSFEDDRTFEKKFSFLAHFNVFAVIVDDSIYCQFLRKERAGGFSDQTRRELGKLGFRSIQGCPRTWETLVILEGEANCTYLSLMLGNNRETLPLVSTSPKLFKVALPVFSLKPQVCEMNVCPCLNLALAASCSSLPIGAAPDIAYSRWLN
jgi:hypothetical protein